jgi:putative sigma-54 modulation protein
MRLELTARNTEITPALRRLVERKIAKLERMLNDAALSAQAVLTREKYRQRAEITLHARGEKFLHGVGNSATWETAVSDAIEKISQQALKVKGKWQERKRRARERPELPIDQPVAAMVAPKPASTRVRTRVPRTMRTARQAVKAMNVSAAARELDAAGDGVVVFRDVETGRVNVLYRGANGDLMLVETEI